MEIFRNARRFLNKIAVVSGHQRCRYKDLLANAIQISHTLQRSEIFEGGPKCRDACVAFIAPPGPSYVEATLGVWLAGGIAVPLCLTHPEKELQYVIENCQASAILATPCQSQRVGGIAKRLDIAQHILDRQVFKVQEPIDGTSEVTREVHEASQRLHEDKGSLIIYTSGTTGRPKGALHTFRSIGAQVDALVSSWKWQHEDRILHTLPLHHVHGIVNALYCPLAVGATVEFQPNFSPTSVWEVLKRKEDPVSVFMGVPTMYNYLLSNYDKMEASSQRKAQEAAKRLRLTVSGSAACPVSIMHRWDKMSAWSVLRQNESSFPGQLLLERYGMTETGMILSNPYNHERKPGTVGLPLPGVKVKLLAEGELGVKGDNVFKEYWQRPDATTDSFTEDGFFKTGDTAVQDEDGYWQILGRASTDIIKSGGYKLSALQIENVLLSHPNIRECAVVGVPDEAMGEIVTAVISCNEGKVTLEDLQEFACKELARYQLPTQLKILKEIPRNAMSKINKKALLKQLFPEQV